MLLRAFLVLASATTLAAQSLPAFSAEALSGRKVTMPQEVQGHSALLVIGFTHGSGPHCTEWAKRLQAEFHGADSPQQYSVIFLEDAPRLVRGMAKSGIKGSVAKDDYDHYLIVTEHEKEVKAAVHFDRDEDAYLVLLGADGRIRWTSHSAAVNDDTVRQIHEQLAK